MANRMVVVALVTLLSSALLSRVSPARENESATNDNRYGSTGQPVRTASQANNLNKPIKPQVSPQVVSATPPEILERIRCRIVEKVEVKPGRGPSASFTVAFDASTSTAPCGKIVEWLWDFGDGFTGRGASVNHTYAGLGVYTGNLSLTDDKGNQNRVPLDHIVSITSEGTTSATARNPSTEELTAEIITNVARTVDKDGDGKRDSVDATTKSALQGGSTNTENDAITGTVVAFDIGLELSDGSCRQTIIVRTKKATNQKKRNDYIIVRYEESCMKLLPERVLRPGPEWHFSLIRNVGCDLLLDDLFYLQNINETGGWVRAPFMKVAAGGDADEIPKTTKLACYTIGGHDFKPALNHHQISGVVIGFKGDPVRGAYVILRYADSDSDRMMVRTDDHGRFTMWIYRGFGYTLRTLVDAVYGDPVPIAATGEIEPLRLVIKSVK